MVGLVDCLDWSVSILPLVSIYSVEGLSLMDRQLVKLTKEPTMSKIWKVPTLGVVCSLPKPSKVYQEKLNLFSLYLRETNGRYKRISGNSYPARVAGMVFSERISNAPLSYSIGAVKRIEYLGVNLRWNR